MSNTPGPWKADIFHGKDGFGIYSESKEHSIASSNLYEHTSYAGAFGKEETEANARLIATAPDGLALANLVKESHRVGFSSLSKGDWQAIVDAATALIAKAEEK